MPGIVLKIFGQFFVIDTNTEYLAWWLCLHTLCTYVLTLIPSITNTIYILNIHLTSVKKRESISAS